MKKLRSGGFLIAKIQQLGERVFAKLLKKHEDIPINPAQGRILFALWKKDAIPINELSQMTKLEKSTLTSMLDRLEKAGYIARSPSETDRRRIIVCRTEKDRALQARYLEVSEEMASLFYRGFSNEEIDAFESYLERILENLVSQE
jgi:MarR family transcriptional regulator, organic hydroperoxide resistance regulator